MGKLRAFKRKNKKGSGCKMCKPHKGKWAKKNKPKIQIFLEQPINEDERFGGILP